MIQLNNLGSGKGQSDLADRVLELKTMTAIHYFTSKLYRFKRFAHISVVGYRLCLLKKTN